MKKNKNNKINKLLSVVSAISSVILLISICILNMIPTKYLLIILGIIILFNIFNMLIPFKLKLNHKGRLLFGITSFIVIIISSIGSFYILKAVIFMGGNFTFKGYSTGNYSVVVLKSSNIDNIINLNGKNVGILSGNLDGEKELIEYINNKIKGNVIQDKDVTVLKEHLYNSTIDTMIVENSYIEILKEEDQDFISNVNIIHTFTLQYKVLDISKDVDVTNDTFTVYLSGIDTYGEISSVARSDVNIIATINPKTHQVLLTSIPRDYYVRLHDTTGYKDKLTHAGIYGIDMSIQTIEDLLDVDINYYVRVNFSSLIKIIDALGGVDVYSEYSFNSNAGYEDQKGYSYSKGYNHLNGDEALAFARTRKAFADGDRQRGKNQQAVIEAIIRKSCSSAIITKYSSILNSLEGSFETNLGQKEISKLAKFQIDEMPSWSVTSISLDGTNGSEYTYTFGNQQLYVMIPSEKSINNAKEILDKIYNNELLESSYNNDITDIHNAGEIEGQPYIEENVDNNHESNNEEGNESVDENIIEEGSSEGNINVEQETREDENNNNEENDPISEYIEGSME